METKKIVESLRLCAEKLGCHRYIIGNCVENISFGKLLDEAADRLEELAAELEKRTINDRPYEWISVEDRLPEESGDYLVSVNGLKKSYINHFRVCENGFAFEGTTHWMPLPEPPKPKEPTFKDVFLEKFPKAVVLEHSGVPRVCAKEVFPQLGDDESPCDMICKECWSRPYFEEEGVV